MAVIFKNKPGEQATTGNHLKSLQKTLMENMALPTGTEVSLGFSETTIQYDGVRVVLPFGLSKVKNGTAPLNDVHAALVDLIGGVAPKPPVPAPVAAPAGIISYDDMTEEQWVEHVAGELFPGVTHLYQAKDLYQAVHGTSGGSIYKTCFIGPNLRIAGRIQKSNVSFRATTDQNNCPNGAMKATLERLGISEVYTDRMTGHAQMTGPYDEVHAHEYRALFGAMYAALKPWITSNFPGIGQLKQGVK